MKKSLSIVLSMLFVLGLAVSAFAIHAEIPAETQAVVAKGTTQITLGGSLRFRGEIKDNVNDFNDDSSHTSDNSSYDGRVRLWINAQTSPNTMGRVQLETGSSDTTDTYGWGVGAEGKGIYTEGNAKRDELRVLEAWILHTGSGLLGTPAGIKVGHMPLQVGYGLFFKHTKFGDDAIMLFADPTKETHIALINAKLTEGVSGTPDDTDLYVGLFTYEGSGYNLSGDATFLNDQNFSADGLHLWNFGLRGDTEITDFGLRAGIELQSGKAKATTDTDYEGYAFLIGANYNLGDIALDAEFARGSGDDNTGDNKIETFVTALHGSQNYSYIYEYRARTAGVTAQSTGASALGATGTGIANTTYYKIGASAKPVKDVSANLALYFLRATEKVSTSSTYDSDEIGVEIDGKVKYEIEKNLTYYVEGGYLWAGDFYKNLTTAGADPDNAYSVRHGLILSF